MTSVVKALAIEAMSEQGGLEERKVEEKPKKVKVKKKKACKVGGLWVDATSFPQLTHEEDKDSSDNH